MSSEHLASAQNQLKGDLAGSWNILDGASGQYTDLGIARRFGGSAAAYSLRDIGAMNGPVVKVRRDMDDPDGDTNDPEESFSASQVASGALEDWVNGKQESTLPADVDTAAAAFSLRKVKDSYAEDVIRVRRIDNTEVDVAFDSDGKVSANSSITNIASGDVDNTDETTLGNFLQGEANVRAMFNNSEYFGVKETNWWSLSGNEIQLGSDPFTISCDFVCTDSFTNNTARVAQAFDGLDFFQFTNSTQFTYRINGQENQSIAVSPALQLGRKYSLEVSRDSSDHITLKINGVTMGTNTVTAQNSGDCHIGRIGTFRLLGAVNNYNFNNGEHIIAGDGTEASNWADTGSVGGKSPTKIGSSHTLFTGQGMNSFVHTWYDQTIDLTELSTYYDTPFAASNFGVTNATEEYGTYLGRDNVVKITTIAGSGQKYHQKDFGIGAGESVRVTAEIYIPSSNTTIDSFALNEKFDVAGNNRKQGLITPTQDQWVDIDFNYVQVDDTSQRILFWDSSTASPTANTDVTGDIIYFRNLIVTRVTKANQDATQETSANQPKIAENGALITENNNTAIDFEESSSQFLLISKAFANSSGADVSIFSVSKNVATAGSNAHPIISNRSGSTNGYQFGYDGTDHLEFVHFADTTNKAVSTETYETQILGSAIRDNLTFDIFGNADQRADNTASSYVASTDFTRIGGNENASKFMDGTMQEIVIFESDQTDNRFKIESNINNYYGLYNDGRDVTGDFVNSGNGTFLSSSITDDELNFDYDPADTSEFFGIQLANNVVNGDEIFISFNGTGGFNPLVLLRHTSPTGGNISGTQSGLDNDGFQSFKLTCNSTNANNSFLVFQTRANPSGSYNVTNLKISRIARNGFVETWYDQSAGGNDLSNPTASEQPDIVINGGLVKTENGQPCLNFQNNVLFTSGASPLDGVANAYFSVFSMKASATGGEVFRNGSTRNANITYASGNTSLYHYYTDGSSAPFVQKTGQGGTNLRIDQFILTGDRDSDSLGAAIDDGSFTTANMTGLSTDAITGNLFIGARTSNPASNDFEGKFAEFIGFNADKSSDRESIRDELNLHYNTF